MIQDVVIATFDRSVEPELRRRVNGMSNSISTAYLIGLRARKVDAGVVKKLLVSLHRSKPAAALEDAVDVYMYHCEWDFARFEQSKYEEQCNVLLQTLHTGLLKICEALKVNVDDFNATFEEVKASNFVYKYRKGKPVANRK